MAGDKVMDHTAYPKRLKKLDDQSLDFIIADATKAQLANPDNPNNGYYADEVNYAGMEKARRNRTEPTKTSFLSKS